MFVPFARSDPSQQGLQLPRILQVSGTAAVVLFRDFNGLQVENPGGRILDGDVRCRYGGGNTFVQLCSTHSVHKVD